MRAHHVRLQSAAILLLATAATLAGCRMGDEGLSGAAATPGAPGPDPARAGSGGAAGKGAPSTPGTAGSGAGGSGGGGAGGAGPMTGPSNGTMTAAGGSGPATGAGGSPPDPGPTPPVTPPPADAGAAPADTGPAASPCLGLPTVPQPARVVDDLPRSDEITFDNEGRLIAFSGNNVVRIVRGGFPEVIARNVVGQRGGAMRVLSDGDIVVADYSRDRLLRIDSRNGVERAPMAVRSPMKLVRGPGGALYVTSTDGIIYRIEPRNSGSGIPGPGDSGDRQIVAQTRLSLGGLSFSADYRKLYVGANDERSIYAFPVDDRGMLGREVRWVNNIPRPQALATDSCGNVYAVGNEDGRIRRISVDGKVTVIAELPAQDVWSLAFGSGKHGFAADALYALDRDDGDLFEVRVGITETPTPTPVP